MKIRLMGVMKMPKTREPLFSIHTHSDGHIAIYLEEQDAVKDLLEDIVGTHDIAQLDYLCGAVRKSPKADGYFEQLESARGDIEQSAPLLAQITEEEALILAEDLIRAVKIARINKEPRAKFPNLEVVK